MNYNDFAEKYKDTALKVANELGTSPVFELSKWAYETGLGTNNTIKYNNLGGIKYVGQKQASGKSVGVGYAMYDNLEDFANDYIRVMKLSYYDDYRKTGATSSLDDDLKEHNKSPYAEKDYNTSAMKKYFDEFKKFFSGDTVTETVEVDYKNPYDLSQKDLVKYAGIGLAVVGIISMLDN